MERRAIAIQGTVQGVGFRPFVWGLASSLDLGGFVHNGGGEVRIEVEGEGPSLDQFVARLLSEPPPLAKIERWTCTAREPRGERRFRIESSRFELEGSIAIAPDAATCEQCLRELFDPRDRRYRYPFLNCTNCGPRLTIVRSVPYDRERTTMASFAMCPACRAEYENPADRRYHAQPIACAVCGPRLAAVRSNGDRLAEADEALSLFARTIARGEIGAMKGIGGYQLVCDARNCTAVAELRRRKQREEKPLAVMARDLAAAAQLCEIDCKAQALLSSVGRPIVLLKKKPGTSIANEVAPGNPFLGIMLPYTPLHHLLLHDLGDMPLVMTSGNRSDEPIAYQETDVMERLAGIADLFLIHDRPIHIRCDDSVTRIVDGRESPVRRSRGAAPHAIRLPQACPVAILAVGGQMKGTFALAEQGRAILSHHLGDLDHFEAYRAFERDVALYEQLFSIRPQCLAHDLHPDYASTRYATNRAAEEGIPAVAIQHHHAHMASCMAEHGLSGPVIGVSFDGTGYGTDGAIWGGEFLVGDYRAFRRAAHLRYVGLPGGERAVREPWRMAVAHLLDAGIEPASAMSRLDADAVRIIEQMLQRKFNSPPTSSAGRLFDAVASLTNLRDSVSFEGQAAMQLEWLASESSEQQTYTCEISHGSSGIAEIDTRPIIRAIVDDLRRGVEASAVARRFHNAMASMIADTCSRIREETGIETAVLSGGVFMNALLATGAEASLRRGGFDVYRHRQVPPNDGGLSLGQVVIATALWPEPNI